MLSKYYEVKVDYAGSNYLGFKITHHKLSNGEHAVTLEMPGAIAAKNLRFQDFIGTTSPVDAPARTPKIQYGKKGEQTIDEHPPAEPVSPSDLKLLQEIIGCNLYLAR